MGKIVLLDDLTINKIAAGEVIERPASVVKEMVENSIDAGAKNITVEIKNGGISLIRIIDDGCGIAEDDMELSFERHATSKIRKADDLETVKTMGFRGEALASIASIANVEMISKREEDETGHRLVIEGGRILSKSEVGAPKGTQITVKNLFFNTPVRYKFLKKDFTEAGYIEDAITRIALVNKNVSIKFINTGKTVIQTNGSGDIKNILYSIYGKDIASKSVEVDYTYEDMRVTGIVGSASIARSNRSQQLFFVNNRYVKDKNLSAAVDQAYKAVLPAGKYGFVILNLEIDPKKVDVNVHPAKLEVRFEEENNVFKAIYHAIKAGLAKIEAEEASKNAIFPVNNENENVVEKPKEEVIENKVKENVQEEEKVEEFKPRAGAFSGFFKKLLGEQEETVEELENNDLREIFENRKNAKERLFDDFNRTKNEDIIKEAGVVENEDGEVEPVLKFGEEKNNEENNEEEINNIENKPVQEVKLGNTIISSDTRELDFDVTSALRGETVKIETTKAFEKSESSKTEVIDSLKQMVDMPSDETIVISPVAVENTENVENKKEEKVTPTLESVESVTEKLMKMKISSDIDDTQMIDTAKVREVLTGEKEEIPMTKEFANMYKKVFGTEVAEIRKNKEEEDLKLNASNSLKPVTKEENMGFFEQEKEAVPQIKYKYIGVVFNTYILVEIKDEIYMIDKIAAKGRIAYEKVKENYYSEDKNDSQMLLLADILTLSNKEMSIAKENKEMFIKAGFDFDEFGDNTIKLTAVPSMCEEMNTKKLFLEILDEMDTVAVTAGKEKEEKFIATVAYITASKENVNLTEEETEQLLKTLFSIPNPFSVPYGKQSAIKITKADMEKKFSRR
jgi:DNA mismatch repair protein MutL